MSQAHSDHAGQYGRQEQAGQHGRHSQDGQDGQDGQYGQQVDAEPGRHGQEGARGETDRPGQEGPQEPQGSREEAGRPGPRGEDRPGGPGRPQHYIKVGTLDARMSAVIAWLSRHGVSLMGTAELSVRGRKSGELRRVPVNPFAFHGTQYLVSARGHSQWVRNMRAAGGGELRLGKSVKTFTATEVPDAERAEILRGYLKKWGWEVGRFFNGVTAKSSDEELLAAAPDHPVFRVTITS